MIGPERGLSLSPDTTGVYTDLFWLNRTLDWGGFMLPEEIRGDSCAFHIWARRNDVSGTAHFHAAISIDGEELASYDFYPAANAYQVYEQAFSCVLPESTVGREIWLTITLESETAGEIRYGEGYGSYIEIPTIIVPIQVLTILDSVATRTEPRDVAWDEAGASVWYVDAATSAVIELDPETGDEVREIPSPCSTPAGLTWDGVSSGGPYLWLSNADSVGGSDEVYRIDVALGAAVDTFDLGLGWCTGLGLDKVTPGGPYLWCLDYGTQTLEIFQIGAGSLVLVAEASTPAAECRPLTLDGEHYWTATVTADEDTVCMGWPGTTAERYGVPGGPEDLALGMALDATSPGGPFLWCADGNRHLIYRLATTATGVEREEGGDGPVAGSLGLVELRQNYPNPFARETVLRFSVAEPGGGSAAAAAEGELGAFGRVRLAVYNVQGQLVRLLFDGIGMDTGERIARWDGLDTRGEPVASGLYFARLTAETSAGEERLTRKMVLFR